MKDDEYAAEFGTYSPGGLIKCQNPWWLPYAVADDMWTLPPSSLTERK